MNQLFSLGKDLLKGGDKSSSSSGSSSGLNPMTMFKSLDKNGDGKITEEDFVLVVQKFGLGSAGDSAVKAIFRSVDTNKNGTLEMSEALAAFEKVKKLVSSGQKSQAIAH